MRLYADARRISGPVVFDRGIPDVCGYLRLSGMPIPPHAGQAASIFRYHRRVLIAPPWPEIFAQDSERKQSFEEAEATYEVMVDTYAELRYEFIQIPAMPLTERVELVLDALR